MLQEIKQNVPMGECIIAATAQQCQARVISDDSHFDSIEGYREPGYKTIKHSAVHNKTWSCSIVLYLLALKR